MVSQQRRHRHSCKAKVKVNAFLRKNVYDRLTPSPQSHHLYVKLPVKYYELNITTMRKDNCSPVRQVQVGSCLLQAALRTCKVRFYTYASGIPLRNRTSHQLLLYTNDILYTDAEAVMPSRHKPRLRAPSATVPLMLSTISRSWSASTVNSHLLNIDHLLGSARSCLQWYMPISDRICTDINETKLRIQVRARRRQQQR